MTSIAIIGAGPAGLLAADFLADVKGARITVFDVGKQPMERHCPVSDKFHYCVKCKPACNIMCGIGGAGMYSSGILNMHPKIGGDLIELAGSEDRALDLVLAVEEFFMRFDGGIKLYNPDPAQARELKRLSSAAGIDFIPIRQRLMGSDHTPRIIDQVYHDQMKRGVEFKTNQLVKIINQDKSLETEQGERFGPFDFLIAAPGRFGMIWLSGQAERLGIGSTYESIDIGARVEVKAEIMEEICNIQRDPKFHIFTKTHDDQVRTFCTNHEGFVVLEAYHDGTIGVNGVSFVDKKSQNTNFALLNRINLTAPLEDSTKFGKAIADVATLLGGGKPIVQRLRDLRRGARSTLKRLKKSNVVPTISYDAITPGDISLAYPHRIMMNLVEGLEQLDKVIPGVASDSTLLYAPEVKYSAKRIYTNAQLETIIPGFFVAGDGAGLTRGIVAAGVTGLIAARAIKDRIDP
ncbi:MAG: FAD-dependent oxidoreductase [Candidatus Lokiarchaeota archaeon]|nr:FAD-dependent oxidoreductase [Candidatus Lokiarchaeota archaeon]